MNCTAIRMNAAQGVDPWDLTIIVVQTLSLLFHLFCAYPIFKMARERFALYILVSKLIAAILLLLASLAQQASNYVPSTKIILFFLNYIVTSCGIFGLVSNRLHIIALAANRAHAMFFPFHYTQKMTKKLIFVQCVFMHLLSIPITYCLYNFIPVYYAGSYVVVPPLFYAAIVTKFAWMKVHNRSWNTEGAAASASDKDSARITWTCFAIQSVALCQLAYISPPPPTTTASESLKHRTSKASMWSDQTAVWQFNDRKVTKHQPIQHVQQSDEKRLPQFQKIDNKKFASI